ncbi:MAG: Methylated-DNA-(protein)-cysteine S-methyltransferase binding protein [Frankiales bacterium]|nr:Methylated-DNA-(protein)-cysteine S-methyltransferase binding protein [Frankiales bacterium]
MSVVQPARSSTEPSLAERVFVCVVLIPCGSVLSYGEVAEYIGTGSARIVGRILATEGYDGLPWHRVLRADGTCAEHIRAEQLGLLRAEGVPIRGDRVQMSTARWDGR